MLATLTSLSASGFAWITALSQHCLQLTIWGEINRLLLLGTLKSNDYLIAFEYLEKFFFV